LIQGGHHEKNVKIFNNLICSKFMKFDFDCQDQLKEWFSSQIKANAMFSVLAVPCQKIPDTRKKSLLNTYKLFLKII